VPSYGDLNQHSIGILMREAVRRAIEEIRAQRFIFESRPKESMLPGGTDLVTIGSTQSGAGLILAFDPAGRRMATIGSVGESGVVLTTAPDGTTTGVLGRAR